MSFKYVLGVETSCDETSAAVVMNGGAVLSNIVSSQIALHKPFGGVVPEIAARNHAEQINGIVSEALSTAGIVIRDVDALAVTNGPGLVGALLVGVSYAKAFAYSAEVPFVGVNHIESHICANALIQNNEGGSEEDTEPPFLALVVSGGHTSLILTRGYNEYELLGATRDDAAGEVFDKAARVLGLGYPGGPAIEKAARSGDPDSVKFPRVKFTDGAELDFSFSGLKTYVSQYVERICPDESMKAGIAASFQQAVVSELTRKAILAAERTGLKKIALAGGVASNEALRISMRDVCDENGYRLLLPKIEYCTDNAAMVACRGYYSLLSGRRDGLNMNAYPSGVIVTG